MHLPEIVLLSTTHSIVAGGFELAVVHSYVTTSLTLASEGPVKSKDDGATERKGKTILTKWPIKKGGGFF